MKKLVSKPGLINIFLLLFITINYILVSLGLCVDWVKEFFPQDSQVRLSLYTSLITAASLVATFSGVLVVFGLSQNTPPFRKARLAGGVGLAKNWVSISSSGFLSALLSLFCLLIYETSIGHIAPWIFITALLLLLHSSIRLLFLLKKLIDSVSAQDVITYNKDSEFDLKSYLDKK